MNAGSFVGRLGPLAAALGIGVAIVAGGTGIASAESPSSGPPSSGPPSSEASSPVQSAGEQRPANAIPGRPSRAPRGVAARATASARPADPVSLNRAARSATRAVQSATGTQGRSSVRPGFPSALASTQLPPTASAEATASDPVATFFGGVAAFFGNQTPALRPTQTGQSAGGVVTGEINANDPDSSALSYTVTGDPARGTVVVDAEGGFVYTADRTAAATGTTDSFQVSVSDTASGFHIHGIAGLINLLTFGLLGSSGHVRTATVGVTVAPFITGNTGPTGTVSLNSPDPASGVVTGRVIGSDPDGDLLSYRGSATTAKGAVVVTAAGDFTYTPTVSARQSAAAPGATLADRRDGFTVTIDDGLGGVSAIAVTVPVTPIVGPATSLAAFPGAEGYGASATGGRDGSVIYVTNLNADGEGSLQWAIDQPGARYILFKVSGLIDTQIHLTNGDVTIAGQTSPGGITIRGLVTDESPYQDQTVQAPADFAENWILQHIRIRPAPTTTGDDGLRLRYTRNAIVDHISIGNALDEAIEISYSHDITVQNTLLAETVGDHSFYGGILMNYSNPAFGFKLDNVSLHHNIFNRIEGRLPEGSRESLAAANSYLNLELSNNLYWDPRFFVELGQSTGVVTDGAGEPYPIYWNLNAVNNYFRVGNSFPFSMFDDLILRRAGNHLFVSGNKMNLYPARSDYQLFYCCNDYSSVTDPSNSSGLAQKLLTRNAFPAITYTPTDQLQNLLLNTAGAWPRDPMDTRLLGFVSTNTISGAPPNTNPAGDALLPAYVGSPPAAPVDTDSDGMPDAWELAKGLNPTVANTNARTLSGVGYTDLEVYLHELSSSRITGWI